MIEELLKSSNGKLLVPILVAVLGATLVKAIFSLHRSKSTDRRDFLDLWSRGDSQSDLWLEVAVRHLFGTYLPASLIRSLLRSPQAGRALLEVSEFWDLLEIHDETLEVRWKKKRHERPTRRQWEHRWLGGLYFVFMGAGLFFAYLAIMGSLQTTYVVSFWIYALFLCGLGLRFLHGSDKLKTAHIGASRWLGLP